MVYEMKSAGLAWVSQPTAFCVAEGL